jgi:4-amino-4-deoxy-L-arabinose transferase-like glycosyltransferase
MIKKIAGTPLYIIVLVNLILKLSLFCYLSPWNKTVEETKIVVSDSKGYEHVAENLLHYGSYAAAKDTIDINKFSEYRETGYLMAYPDGWMMPVYPTLLAGVYSIVGIKPFVAILVQILLSLFSVVSVYRICTLFFENTNVAAIASFLFAIDIHSIYSANELLTDTLFVLLFLSAIYYFLKGMKSEKLTTIAIGAIFMGLACLTRLLVLIYPSILIVILFLFLKKEWKWKLKAVVIYILIFASMNGIWSLRNHNFYNHWQLTSHGGWTLLIFNTSMAKEKITHDNLDSIRVDFQRQADSMGFRKTKDIFNQSEIYRQVAMKYIMQHKGMYLLTSIEGCMNMFLSLGNMGMAKTLGWTDAAPKGNLAEISSQRIAQNFSSNIRETLLGILIMLVIAVQYIGAIYGIVKLKASGNYMLLWFGFLTVAYFAAVTGILGSYRFKLPLVPLICIIAGYGYFCLMQKKTNHLA